MKFLKFKEFSKVCFTLCTFSMGFLLQSCEPTPGSDHQPFEGHPKSIPASDSGTIPSAIPSATPTATPTATPSSEPSTKDNPSTISNWESGTIYTRGAQVTLNGVEYIANWWTQGQDPFQNNGPSGSGQPWTVQSLSSVTTSPPSSPAPSSFPITPNSPNLIILSNPPTSASFLFSPYKDVTINMNWNTHQITTAVTGAPAPILAVIPQNQDTMTWAFATGACGHENWGGIDGSDLAASNVNAWVSAGKKYIISTGGAAGSFTCTNDADFTTFIHRYYSNHLVGIDFDIEAGQSQNDINNLVLRVKNAQSAFPNLRFSFTVATLGGNVSPSLGTFGTQVMQAIQTVGLKHYFINLMAMDYGSPAAGNCILGASGQCDMGQSAIQSAIDLHNQYGLPYSQIEVTPMVGGNDSANETFTLADVQTLSSFARQNGLGGIHFWSFDRDNDCAAGAASALCNTYGLAGTLGFTTAFLSHLGD